MERLTLLELQGLPLGIGETVPRWWGSNSSGEGGITLKPSARKPGAKKAIYP